MELLTKDEVQALTCEQMADYINSLCREHGINEWLGRDEAGHIIDLDDPDTPIKDRDELYDLILSYNTEGTDLEGKIFAFEYDKDFYYSFQNAAQTLGWEFYQTDAASPFTLRIPGEPDTILTDKEIIPFLIGQLNEANFFKNETRAEFIAGALGTFQNLLRSVK